MQARMQHPAMVVPGAMQAVLALSHCTAKTTFPQRTRYLVQLRASQINGCSVCVIMHANDARKAGESEERLFAVGAWRETPYFDAAERAALDLTEAVTRLSDQSNAVPDEIWNEAARHYDEPELAALVLDIAVINLWNRLNGATHQIAGSIPV